MNKSNTEKASKDYPYVRHQLFYPEGFTSCVALPERRRYYCDHYNNICSMPKFKMKDYGLSGKSKR